MPNVCFYVEPLILHSKPTHYWAWLKHAYKVAQLLEKIGYDYRIVTSLPLARHGLERFQLPSDKLCILLQRDLKGTSCEANAEWLRRGHYGELEASKLEGMAESVRRVLNGFEPDVVFSLSPVEHVKHAYPKAEVLYMDCGVFSRDPFPLSWFFDPQGLFDLSILGTQSQGLREYAPSDEQWSLLHGLRERVGDVFERLSPLTPHLEHLRTQSQALWLLPLHLTGEMAWAVQSSFRNVGEVIYHVMEHVPPEVGVIVTEHPTSLWTGDYLDNESLEAIRADFPNLLVVDEWRRMTGVSHTLISQVDAVLAVGSSLGLQALVWDTPVVCLGNSHLSPFAAAHSIEEAVESLATLKAPEGTDAAMCWLLNHYWVPEPIYTKYGWLARYIDRIQERRAAGNSPLELFDPIDDPDALLDVWTSKVQDYQLGKLEYLPANL